MMQIRKISAGNAAIMLALDAGYYASDDGTVFRPDNVAQDVRTHSSTGYLIFNLPRSVSGPKSTVLSHRLCAAYFFGRDALLAGVIRHLDGVTTNNSRLNLRPGTYSENEMDKPIEMRRRAMTAARAAGLEANGLARARKLSDDQVRELRRIRSETGMLYRELASMFGVSLNAAWSVGTRRTFAEVSDVMWPKEGL